MRKEPKGSWPSKSTPLALPPRAPCVSASSASCPPGPAVHLLLFSHFIDQETEA